MKKAYQQTVYEISRGGKIICVGDADECAAALGMRRIKFIHDIREHMRGETISFQFRAILIYGADARYSPCLGCRSEAECHAPCQRFSLYFFRRWPEIRRMFQRCD